MLATAGAFLVRLLWPDRCAACQQGIVEGRIFCEGCEATVVPLETACPGCALPDAQAAPPNGPGTLCWPCSARPFPFSAARACLMYGGAVADAIVRFKHGRGLALARPLGRALVPLIQWAEESGVDALLPVPLHPRRLRARGFNQALELVREARAFHRRAAVRRSAAPPAALWTSALVRHRDTPAQGRDSPLVRRSRVAGAFVVPRPMQVRGRRLLVLDDVMTTGATLAECAGTLLAAGAREVLVGALARAGRSGSAG